MIEERNAEVADFEADLRRTTAELVDGEHIDMEVIVRENVRRYWRERYAYEKVVRKLRRTSVAPELSAQFSADLRRTRQELSGGSIDIEALVSEGAKGYWDTKQGRSVAGVSYAPEPVAGMAAMLRQVSETLQPHTLALPEGEIPVARQICISFVAVFVALVGTALILVRTTDVPLLFRIVRPWHVFSEHARFASTAGLTMACFIVGTIILAMRPSLRRWSGFVMGSAGAAVVLAIFGMGYVDTLSEVQATEERLSNKLLVSLDAHGSAASTGPTFTQGFREQTESLRGAYVALVTPNEAKLEWQVGNRVEPRGRFVIGTVTSVNDDRAILAVGGATFPVDIPKDQSVTAGQRLIVHFNALGKTEWLAAARDANRTSALSPVPEQ
jgi:hypothetical protein